MKDILIRGGDTDTNAAIIGGLLGARDGKSKLDKAQVEKVLSCFRENQEEFNEMRNQCDFLIPGLSLERHVETLYQKAPTKLVVVSRMQEYTPMLNPKMIDEIMGQGWDLIKQPVV
jgi:hypothetical protein